MKHALARMNRLLPLLPLLCGACASGDYRLGLELHEENEAIVEVMGTNPEVQVINDGPGRLLVSFEAPEVGEAREVRKLDAGRDVARGENRLVTVWLWTEDGVTTNARLIAHGADGLHLLQSPMPRRGE